MISVKGVHYRLGGKGRTKAQKRLALFRRQKGLCAICGQSMTLAEASLDHIIPRAHVGTNRYANLRAAHRACNAKRGASMSDLFIDVSGLRALRWNIRELP